MNNSLSPIIDNLPNHKMNNVQKVVYTGTACALLSGTSGLVGAFVKIVSLRLTPTLHRILGTRKINAVFADILSAAIVSIPLYFSYSVELPFASAVTVSIVSIAISLLSIKSDRSIRKLIETTFLSAIICHEIDFALIGASYSLVSKTVSTLVNPILNNRLGAKKVHEVFSDILAHLASFGALYTLAKIGLITLPITLGGSFGLTLISLLVTALNIKNAGAERNAFFSNAAHLFANTCVGGEFGLTSKSISLLLATKLKIHPIFADCIAGTVTYGAFATLAQFGCITPVSLSSLMTFTAISLSFSIITLKVVYTTLSTFFFCNLSNNGKLEEFANLLLMPLRTLFTGALVQKCDTSFVNKKEAFTGLDVAFEIALRSLFIGSACSGFLILLNYLVETSVLISYAPLLIGITPITLLFLGIFISPFIGAPLKLLSWILNPSTLRNNWQLIEWRSREKEELGQLSRFSSPLAQSIVKDQNLDVLSQNNPVFKIAPDILATQLLPHLSQTDLFSLLSTSKASIAFSKLYFEERAEGKRNTILHTFPKEVIDFFGGVGEFEKLAFVKMKAHRVKKGEYSIQATDSHKVEGTFSTAHTQFKGITSFSPSDMGDQSIAWTLDPLPSLVFRVSLYTEDHFTSALKFIFKGESVAIFHPTIHPTTKQKKWVISIPLGIEISEKEHKIFNWLKGLIQEKKMSRLNKLGQAWVKLRSKEKLDVRATGEVLDSMRAWCHSLITKEQIA